MHPEPPPEPWDRPREATVIAFVGVVLATAAMALMAIDGTAGLLAAGAGLVAAGGTVGNAIRVRRRANLARDRADLARPDWPDPTFYDQDNERPWQAPTVPPAEVISLTDRRRRHP